MSVCFFCLFSVQRGMKLQEHIVIGTPGTMLDWCSKFKFIDPKKIKVFVLDEADVMIATQGHQDQSIRIQRWAYINWGKKRLKSGQSDGLISWLIVRGPRDANISPFSERWQILCVCFLQVGGNVILYNTAVCKIKIVYGKRCITPLNNHGGLSVVSNQTEGDIFSGKNTQLVLHQFPVKIVSISCQ